MLKNKRLLEVAKYVDSNDSLVDIGTDHALLPIHLSTNKLVKNVIAADLNEMPLQVGIDNAKKFGCNNIEFFISNGLEKIKGEYDTISIAGMGGVLITEILDADKSKVKGRKLILQPNNSEAFLRKYLKDNNFKIIDESVVYENDIWYEVIFASETEGVEINDYTDLIVGPVLKTKIENKDKVESRIKHLESFVDKTTGTKKEETTKQIKTLKEILCNYIK